MVWGYASVGGKKARGASFFAAPKKEGKKRAFFKRIWLTAFGRVPVTIIAAMSFLHTFLETQSIAVEQGFSGWVRLGVAGIWSRVAMNTRMTGLLGDV